MTYNFMTAAEAASLIKDGEIIALSGFTPAGSPKAVTAELARQAEEKHARGEHFQVGIITGASTGDSCDGVLTRAHAIHFRAPYTTNTDFRKAVNAGEINYTDIHLSQVAQRLRSGFLGHVTTAIIEACEITEDGRGVIVPAGAEGVSITATVHTMGINGNVAPSNEANGIANEVKLTIVSSAVDAQTVPVTNYVVNPANPTKAIDIALGDVFAQFPASAREAVRRGNARLFVESEQEEFLVKGAGVIGSVSDAAVFGAIALYDADWQTWNMTTDDMLDLKYLHFLL